MMAKLQIRQKESLSLLVVVLFIITLFCLFRSVTITVTIPPSGGTITNNEKDATTLSGVDPAVVNNQLAEPPPVQAQDIQADKTLAVINKPIKGEVGGRGGDLLKPPAKRQPSNKKSPGKKVRISSLKTHEKMQRQKHIVIAAALCAKFGDGGPLVKASIMVKSLLVSAKLYNISKVDVYLFLEYREDELLFLKKLEQFGYKNHKNGIHINFRHVQDAIPADLQKNMLYHKTTRCNYAKIFLPSALAKDKVDAVLYLDIDTIVTGDPTEIWKHFSQMDSNQLVGLTRDSEPEYPTGLKEYLEKFGDIPLPVGKGLNTGVLLMNLTRMRTYKWEEKLLQVHKDYRKILKKPKFVLNDQKIINIYLYYAHYLFYILPCSYNIRTTHCTFGLYCKDAEKDPIGIHVVHGANGNLDAGGLFFDIFKAYDRANLKNNPKVKYLKKEIMEKIRKAYAPPSKSSGKKATLKSKSKCYGTINKLLFKNYFIK